jgi:transposase-like protein
MRPRVSTIHLLSLALLLLLSAAHAAAQGNWTLRLRVTDGGGGVDTLFFGTDPRATYCIDPHTFFDGPRSFLEYELPPAPPGGVFDTRMVNHRTGLGGCITATERGNGLRFDIRPPVAPGGKDTFNVRFQVGTAGPITLSWPSTIGVFVDSAVIQDAFGGLLLKVNMLTQQSLVVTNVALSPLTMILFGAPSPVPVSPSSGATVPPDVDLVWNALAGATVYRLQVATDSSFSAGTLIVNDSTLTTVTRSVTGLSSPATFYWRIAAGTPSGWGAWSVQRVFRTGAVPAAPAPVEPADGALNQPSSVLFRWTSSADATTYHLQVATDSTFAGGIAFSDSTLADTLRTVTGLAFGTTFYWRAAGRNDIGRGSWSARRSFTTQLQPPPAPVPGSPTNGQTNVSVTPELSWSVPGGGSGLTFRVQVATDAGFSAVVLDDTTVTGLTRSIGPLQTSTQHFWKITARNQAGYGPSSPVWSFTTVPPLPAAPVLQAPPNNAVDVPLSTTLQWAAAAGAATYRLQVATDTAFTNRIVDDSSLTGTSRQVGPLQVNTVYYWRVGGRNAAGGGPWSSRFRFTSSAAPPVPLQSSPVDGAVRVDRSARFVWAPVAGATAYHLQVGADAGFAGLLVNDSTITDTVRVPAQLPYGARLWWRIRSRNTAGRSAFSPGWAFTVQLQPPAPAVQISPANNATGQPVPAPFRWQAASLAWWYQVQIALDTLMTNMFISDSAVADTARSYRVAPNTAYYWRVRGINTEGTPGPWSAVRRLTTGNVPPATPVPFYPAQNDTNVSRTPMLQWLASPGALTYRVQVARDNLFTQLVADDSLVSTNRLQPGLLQAQTTYFWRVRARGTAGLSPYAVIQRFTTGSLIVAVEEDGRTRPEGYELLQNYPNPFNPSTTVQYAVPVRADVTLTVYSLLGQEIITLADGAHAPGIHTAVWNGTDAAGRPVPSGVYLVRMTASGGDGGAVFSSLRKMVLMK